MIQLLNKVRGFFGGNQTQSYRSSASYVGSNLAKSSLIFTAMKGFGKPDIMLGILPVYNVQTYEVGRSMEVLKFRAAKGQFFKQQEGTDVSLRIDLILTGPYREIILNLLEIVYISGNTQNRQLLHRTLSNVDTSVVNTDIFTAGGSQPSALGSPSSTWFKPKNVKDIGKIDDDKNYDGDWHSTFTFMSATDVLFDMYIENYVVERSVRGGYNAIYVSLFCKKFYPPNIIKVVTEEKVSNKQQDINIDSKTYGGRQPQSKESHTITGGNTYYPRKYEGPGGITRIHTVPTFFNNSAPNVGKYTKTLYGNDYSKNTRAVGHETQYKPDNADWIDLSIRAVYRLYTTFKRFREQELNFEMTEMGIIPWNYGVDIESTKTPEVKYASIPNIVYKNTDIREIMPDKGLSEALYI